MLLDLMVVSAALLCAMVTGLLLGFLIVAMPGIGTLEDRAFLRAFQVMDEVIQDRQPWFMVLWAGSVVAVLGTAVVGIIELEGIDRALSVAAAVVYLLGVQLPTATINIPLNNLVQTLDLAAMDEPFVTTARADFEARWNRWNAIRTVLGMVSTLMLLVLLLRMSG